MSMKMTGFPDMQKVVRYSEPVIWSLALIVLYLMYPTEGEGVTLCLFHHIGIAWCPGCGIGRSMAHFLHGDITASLKSHWFGIPAVLIIFYRILTLALITIPNKTIFNPINKHGEQQHA
ncbi:MAG: DUF2752 domain-containing protein [Balneolaceae bacterium]|nr:MAG: DUF2752 domain-containing protein [Balneolaceae bacterium]